MRRRLSTLASAVSLLLFAATAALWLRSNWVGDLLYWNTVDETGAPAIYGIDSAATPVGSRVTYVRIATTPPMTPSFTFGHSIHLLLGHQALGSGGLPRFGYVVGDVPLIPHWSISLVFVVLPAARLVRWAKAKRLPKPGQCPACRYDLTGNTSGTCPECGARIQLQNAHEIPDVSPKSVGQGG